MYSEESDKTYSFEFDEYGARLLQKCVDHYVKMWPGGDAEEQESLKCLQTIVHSIVLEYEFEKE